MIDASKIKYKIIGVTSGGTQYDITNAVVSAGWEEGENEIAQKISISAVNADTSDGAISDILPANSLLVVRADWGNGYQTVAMGQIIEWATGESGSADTYDATAYDCAYCLQKSQENYYFAAGQGTRAIFTQICGDWSIPLEYNGPDITHEKMVYKNKAISTILQDILDDAKKKGGQKAIVRATEMKIQVVPLGSNTPVYVIDRSKNEFSVSVKISTANLVTRVKIVGQSDSEDGCPPVESLLNGKTEFGIRQKIYNHSKSDTMDDATKAAQAMLDEDGAPEQKSTVKCIDVPPVRKGDLIYLKSGNIDGMQIVKSVQHNADEKTMSMVVEKYEAPAAAAAASSTQSGEYPYVGKCTGNSVNVRTGPGTEYPNISGWPRLNIDNLVDVNGKEGDWYKVGIQGNDGYVYAQYITKV